MDDRRFDALIKMLGNDGSRRGVVQILGASALAGVFGRLTGMAAEAKKKGKKKRRKKKCKGDTRKCGKKCIPADNCCVTAECDSDEVCKGGACVTVGPACVNDDDCPAPFVCIDGVCVDDGNQVECQVDGDCAANEDCINGECRCAFPQKPCSGLCCASNEACVNGVCVVGQGTCAAGEDLCAGTPTSCNGNENCRCVTRLDDGESGESRCILLQEPFIDDSLDDCTCDSDFRCEQDFGAGTICIKSGATCQCQITGLGRCARLCPGSS